MAYLLIVMLPEVLSSPPWRFVSHFLGRQELMCLLMQESYFQSMGQPMRYYHSKSISTTDPASMVMGR